MYDDPVIAPDFMPFDRLTYHADPAGRFDSVNFTEYNTFENDTGISLFDVVPFTLNDPPFE